MDKSIEGSSKIQNGYFLRQNSSRSQQKLISRLPFSLIAKNNKLSKSFFGISPYKSFSDVQFKDIKNTMYISHDYEQYCNRDLPATCLKRTKKIKNKSKSNAVESKETSNILLKPCKISVRKISYQELIKYKLSPESYQYLEESFDCKKKKRLEPLNEINENVKYEIDIMKKVLPPSYQCRSIFKYCNHCSRNDID